LIWIAFILSIAWSAVAECLEARGHVEAGPIGAIRIDDCGPFAGGVVASGEHKKSQK
jgi:putative component of membrane protein insertase Oxa1/YidC/SpoIIIJ protein YidD